MIATPEQYRTLADLIERLPIDGIIMYRDTLLAAGKKGGLWRIYKDGTFDKPKFLDAETMR